MEQWKTNTLQNLCTIGDGNHSSQYPKKSEMVESGVPFIRGNNLKDGELCSKDILYISPEKHKELKKGHLRTGDVLFTNRGEIGKVAIVTEYFNGANLNSQIAWLRCGNQLLPKYLLYSLQTKAMTDLYDSEKSGAALQQFTIRTLRIVEVHYPPIPEQQRIVAILDQAFADIEKARANAEKNLKNARELFDSYLNQVFSQRGEGWVETLLGDVCGFKHGFAFKSEYFTQESNLVLLTPGNFFEEGGYRDRGSKQKYYNGPFPREFLLPKGCLLVAMTEQAAGLLGSSLVVPEENTFLHNQRLGLVQLTETWEDSISLEFLSQLFNAQYFRAKVQETGSGLKVRHTSPKKLQAITVWIPKVKDEQCKIVNDIAHLKNETMRLELVYQQKLQSLDELKKSLLQKAFSGELTKTEGMVA